MADSYRVGPKPLAAKTKREQDERKELHRRVDRINEGKDPYKGDRVVDPMDKIKSELKVQKAKAGASNPAHNMKKYD